MLILVCPYCHTAAEETELTPGGEAHLSRVGPDGSAEAFEAYLFARRNPAGVHFERWRHSFGCGRWFLAARDTGTMQVYGTYKAQTSQATDDIVGNARKARPEWVPDWPQASDAVAG